MSIIERLYLRDVDLLILGQHCDAARFVLGLGFEQRNLWARSMLKNLSYNAWAGKHMDWLEKTTAKFGLTRPTADQGWGIPSKRPSEKATQAQVQIKITPRKHAYIRQGYSVCSYAERKNLKRRVEFYCQLYVHIDNTGVHEAKGITARTVCTRRVAEITQLKYASIKQSISTKRQSMYACFYADIRSRVITGWDGAIYMATKGYTIPHE